MMRWTTLIFCLLLPMSLWSFPSLEGLLRNNANGDHDITLFALKVSPLDSQEMSQENDLVFSLSKEGSRVFVKTKNGELEAIHQVDFDQGFFQSMKMQGTAERALLSLAHSLLFNKESTSIKMINSICGNVPSQLIEVNQAKKDLLDELKTMVKKERLKEEQIWKGLNQGQIFQTQRILNQPYYLTSQGLKLILENGQFYYQTNVDHCHVLFNAGDLGLQRFNFVLNEMGGEIELSDYIAFNGVYLFPSRILLKDLSSSIILKVSDLTPLEKLPSWVKKAKILNWVDGSIWLK